MAKKSFLNKNWKYIMIFVVLCLAAGAIYYFFWHKKTIEFFTDDVHMTVIGNFVQKPIVNAQQLVIMVNKSLVELDKLNQNNEVTVDKVKKVAEVLALKVLSADNIKTIESDNNSTIHDILADSATKLFNDVKRDHPKLKYSTLKGANVVNLLNNDKIKSYVTSIRGISTVNVERFESEAQNGDGETIGDDKESWKQSEMGKCFVKYLMAEKQIEPWWLNDYSIVSIDSIVEAIVNGIQTLPKTTKATLKKKHLKNMVKELMVIYMGTETPCTGLEDSVELIGQQIMALREVHASQECGDMYLYNFFMQLNDINDEKLMLLAKDALKMRKRYCWKFGEKPIDEAINVIYRVNKDEVFSTYNEEWVAVDENGNTDEWLLWGHIYNMINDLMGQVQIYDFTYGGDIEAIISKYAEKFETSNLAHLFKDSMVDTYETHPIRNFGATINRDINYRVLYNFRNKTDSDFFNIMREAFYKIFGSIIFKGIIMSKYMKNVSQHGLRNNAQVMWNARDNTPINIINNIVILSNGIAAKIEDGTLESTDSAETASVILKSYILYEFGLLETFDVPPDGHYTYSQDLNIETYMYYWSVSQEKATEALHAIANDMLFVTKPDGFNNNNNNNNNQQIVEQFSANALFTEADFQAELNALTNLNINHEAELTDFNAQLNTFINRGDIVVDVNLNKSYKCENNQCIEDPNGEYDTLAECQAACIDAANNANRSYNYVDNMCVGMTDDTGVYSSLAECQAAHPLSPSKYSCVNGLCALNTDGTYNTMDDCQTNCGTATQEKYKCENGACIIHPDGTYSSLDNCQANCTTNNINGNLGLNYFACENGNCVASDQGTFPTLGDCQTSCTAATSTKYRCGTEGCVPDAIGPYNSLNDCQTSCASVPTNRFRCNDGSCIANDNGPYNSLNNCEDNCTQDPTIETDENNNNNIIGSNNNSIPDVRFHNPFNEDNINQLPIGEPSSGSNNLNDISGLTKIYLGIQNLVKEQMVIAYAYIFRDQYEPSDPDSIKIYIYDKNGNFMGDIYHMRETTGKISTRSSHSQYNHWKVVFNVDWDDSDMLYADKHENIPKDENGYITRIGNPKNNNTIVNPNNNNNNNNNNNTVVNPNNNNNNNNIVNQQGQPIVNQQGRPVVVNQQGQPIVVNQQGQPIVNQQGQQQTGTESVSPAMSDYDISDFGRVSMNNYYSSNGNNPFSYSGNNNAVADIYQQGTKGVSNIYSPRIFIDE